MTKNFVMALDSLMPYTPLIRLLSKYLPFGGGRHYWRVFSFQHVQL